MHSYNTLFDHSSLTLDLVHDHSTESLDVPLEFMDLFDHLPMFEKLKEEKSFTNKLFKIMNWRTFQQGDIIIQQGQKAKAMFFLLKGTVDVVSDDNEIIFASLDPPTFCKHFFVD